MFNSSLIVVVITRGCTHYYNKYTVFYFNINVAIVINSNDKE